MSHGGLHGGNAGGWGTGGIGPYGGFGAGIGTSGAAVSAGITPWVLLAAVQFLYENGTGIDTISIVY